MGKARVDLRSVTTVGLDLAKHVFQIHAVDADGKIVIATALRRREVLSFFDALPPCVIGLEACGSAHHWARELVKLGHDARLMPPSYVKAYVRRQKNDAADAAAICEAVTRPSMQFVPIRSIDNQAVLMHHKVREILVSQRTQLLNALRGHLAEVGVIAVQGPNGAYALAAAILEGDSSIPLCVRDALAPIVRQLQTLNDEIAASDRAIMGLAKTNETARRLMSVPGIGPITASAIAASVQDVGAFWKQLAAIARPSFALALKRRSGIIGGRHGHRARPRVLFARFRIRAPCRPDHPVPQFGAPFGRPPL